jgi:hypothetical protein
MRGGRAVRADGCGPGGGAGARRAGARHGPSAGERDKVENEQGEDGGREEINVQEP